MATLNARIAELEKMTGSQDVQQWLIILTGFDQGDEPLTKLACHPTGKFWEIDEGETESDFTARIEREAFPDGESGALMVTRVK